MASSDSSDYEETELETTDIPCAFCGEVQADELTLKRHSIADHEVDLFDIFGRMGDVFQVIKAINYLRKEQPSPEKFSRLVKETPHPWDAEEFLQPVVPNDPLLRVDFEEAFEKHHGHAFKHEVDDIALLKEQLQVAYERIASMQRSAKAILGDGDRVLTKQVGEPSDLAISTLKVSEDLDYIDSYSHFGIHQEMLQDVDRNEAYRLGILANEARIQGRTCLDVGCGTGILSMFLAREGKAAYVQAVDFSEIIYSAMDIARENNYYDVVAFKKGKFEDLAEKQGDDGLAKVDVIVSEWMGYFLLFESMLDTVIAARDKLLKPGGLILPCKASMFLTITDRADVYERHVAFWDDVYGFKMTCMKKPCVAEALIEACCDTHICGSEVEFKTFDMYSVTTKDTLFFSSNFDITANRDAKVTAIVGYFDVHFDPDEKIKLSTRPTSVGKAATHWKQTLFLLPEPITLAKDEHLKGKICVKRSSKSRRGIDVEINLDNRSVLKYTV